MKMLFVGAMAALIVNPSAAGAKSLAKLPASLDPAKAYALVEVGNIDDARIKGALTLARYDSATSDIAVLEQAKPAQAREAIGKPLVKEDKRRLYLLELSPGQWVIEGANGTAFSLGSRTFELTAGTLTDLGVAAVTTDYAEGETPYKLTAGKMLKLGLFGALAGGNALPQPIPKAVTFRARTASDLAVPKIANAVPTPVGWGGEVKFGNYLGGLVNRMGGRKDRPAAAAAGPAEAPAAQR